MPNRLTDGWMTPGTPAPLDESDLRAVQMSSAQHVEGAPPKVSVVTATYNRPEVLAFAIRSVRAQDLADWEMIVVGDCCSETTGETVRSFGDARIHYINLALNCGDQSGPNNFGLCRARGRYVAFLNHDDVWFPDHLRASIEWLEATGADGVIARGASIPPPRPGDSPDDWSVWLSGMGTDGRYHPVLTTGPASTLVLKTSAARTVKPWRRAAECFSSSSQEWLFRLWRHGFDIRTMPHLTVLLIPSGSRRNSYVNGDKTEHEYFETRLLRPDELRVEVLSRVPPPPSHALWRRCFKSIAVPLLHAVARLGYPPSEIISRNRLGASRGDFINSRRRNRGLATLPDPEPSAALLCQRYSTRLHADKGRRRRDA